MTAFPSWAEVKDRFEWDGSWRDVYVLNTTRSEWEMFLALLATSPVSAVMTRGDDRIALALPDDFPMRSDDRPLPLLHFTVAGILCACHFFSDDVIAFDIDPREMKTEEQFGAFISFLGQLRDQTGKDVILTEENGRDDAILRLPANKGLN